MEPDRIFLDWSTPVTDGVCNRLLPDAPLASTIDLSDTLVIVPTAQAGRRLREALALRCAEQDTALIPPVVKEPLFFTSFAPPGARIAGPLLTHAVWTSLLCDVDPQRYPCLFPSSPPHRDPAWAARMAEHIQRVRDTLADGGYLIRDVVRQYGQTLEEPERWQDVEQLETAYLKRLDQAGWTDRIAHLIQQAESPSCPPEIRRIIVAAVPDPSPLMIRALTRLAADTPTIVLVHAPETCASDFDVWGRPIPDAWHDKQIDVPNAERNILPGSTPLDQARLVIEIIAEEAGRIGPSDLAIGVPDMEVAPYVDTHLAEHGLVAFNPAGMTMNQHRLYHVLEAYRAVLADPTYRAVSNLLRQPDILLALESKHEVNTARLLADLDKLQNRRLPQTFDDLLRLTAPDTLQPTPDTFHAIAFIARLLDCAAQDTLEQVIASLMEQVYANQTINPQEPEDDAFRVVATRINRLIAETRESLFNELDLSTAEALKLLLRALANEYWYEERKDAQIDLEGWLELPWNTARLLIITGMNDGHVPDSRLGDVFLPDSLRQKIGLRSDADRLARDAYLMTALIESRRSDGRVCFIAGAYGGGGDPLRPSRLLFRCADTELPARAARLFREPAPNILIHHATAGFRLDPFRDRDMHIPESIRVTAFSAYLACPFRYYLSYILHMQALRDDKAEMDALDFGSLMHHALQGLQEQPTCAEESDLIALFVSRAETWLHKRFGARPPLPVLIQFESARQRLIAAARAQADLAREGWAPTYFEEPVRTMIGSMEVSGAIDRVDYHPDTQAWRIIDYKTMDQREPPEKTHLGTARDPSPAYALAPTTKGKPKRWRNLQLPLYAALFRALEPDARASVGYFQLPRAVSDTGYDAWDGLTEELLASAWTCAQGVAHDIQQGLFWPPADDIVYDDYETLFPLPATHCVEPPRTTARTD